MNWIILSIFLSSFQMQEEEWILSIDKDDIQVFTKKVDGSRINKFLARTQVIETPNAVLDLLKNIEDYKNWIDRCSSAEIIHTDHSDGEWSSYIHTKISVPFIQDRDLVQKFKIIPKPNGFIIEVTSLPNYISEVNGLIRMHSAGFWNITIEKNGLTLVEMEFTSDPMGSIPPWIINSQLTKSPYKTLKNLREILEKN